MKIAATYGEKGRMFQHFSHTTTFRIYEINEENKVSKVELIDTNGATCCALADFLKNHEIDILICGGIGENAINKLTNLNIKVVNGVDDDCDIAVAKFLADKLEFSLVANCEHERNNVPRHSCHSHHDDCHDCD